MGISFKNEFVCNDLKSFDRTVLDDNTTLFLGFNKKEIKKIVYQFATSIGSNVKYISSITELDEFVSAIAACKENDFILFNCGGITKSQEILSVITDVINDGQITITIWKGLEARVVTLDVPKLNYIFLRQLAYMFPKC